MIKELDKKGFEEAILTSGKPIVVDFTAEWCPYCKLLAPVLEEIASEYADELEIYYVDTDKTPEIAAKYDVMALPTVLVFKDGKLKENALNPRTKEATLKLIFD